MELTLNPIKKMLRKSGAKRVSDGAALELGKLMEHKTVEICKRANKLSEFSERRTVMKKDIKLAAKHS